MNKDEILESLGWTIVCQSPLTIEHIDGSSAIGMAAEYAINGIISDYESQIEK